MKQSVLVLDYGVGNLLSVCRAFEACGADVTLTGERDAVGHAERLVLPGVGAFGDCMDELRRRDLIGPVLDFAASGRPMLGICVGMQMMMEIGEEFGERPGLGLVRGRVRAIPAVTTEGRPHKIPHIGWTPLVPPFPGRAWDGTIMAGIDPGQAAYFVHSFTAEPVEESDRLADCRYGGQRVCAALAASSTVFGTQFHPEKSGPIGLAILRNFLALPGRAA